MREIKRKSVVPIYGAAAVWVLYCLLLPLYKPSHLLYVILLSAAAYFGLSKVFPGTVEKIPEKPAEEPAGDPRVQELLDEGKRAETELLRLKESIRNPEIGKKIDRIIETAGKIFRDAADDPSDIPRIKQFANYYLPTTIKLLNAYDRMADQGVSGENIGDSLSRIEKVLDTTIEAYDRQLDALFANENLDIETDITVLENMMKREGLTGSDFTIDTKGKKQ